MVCEGVLLFEGFYFVEVVFEVGLEIVEVLVIVDFVDWYVFLFEVFFFGVL